LGTQDPKALLKRLLEEPAETPWLEFKQNNADPELIGRCVAACANAAILAEKDRAYIVFGVENVTKARAGTSVCLRDLRKGGENLENWLARMVEPHLVLEFLDFEDQGKNFAIIVVAPSYDRPVRFSGVEYIRIGENVKPLKEHPEHERALWLATSRQKFEGAVAASHQSTAQVLEKLDIDALYSLISDPRPKTDIELFRKLVRMEVIREDMEGGYDITNLGAVLLAKNLASFPSIATKSVRVIKYVGKDKRKSEREIEGQKGYASGFTGLLNYVWSALPFDERYVEGVRKLVPIYPQTALREFIANALIHQDFTLSGAGPVVEIYEDRVEITNPGNSLITVERLIDERRSRNEKLAHVMRQLGICEERGGGIDKAILEIEEMSLPAPSFIASADSMRVVVFGPKKFSQLSKAEKSWACFCHCVVRWIRHDFMSNTSLRERFKLPASEYQAVSAVIADTRKAGRIVAAEKDQGKRNARYVPYWVQK
jgi:ATP-dependent DNA helicase RecG